MTFKGKLYNLLDELKQHNNDRSSILQSSIEARLDFALSNYNKKVIDSYNYLSYRGSLRVMKKLNKG